MKWLQLLLVGALMLTGCGGPRGPYKAYRIYYDAVMQQDYVSYKKIVLKPMNEEQFKKLSSKVDMSYRDDDPVCKITVGREGRDSYVTGRSPWTAKIEEFRIREIGNKYMIIE